jgi:peptidoglycan hydrolase-like protein with peptidoglycan-binding domain
MIACSRVKSAAISVGIAFLTAAGAQAQNAPEWRLHTTLEGEQRPLLCKDPETVDLIVAVLGRAIEARAADADKAKRLFELAAKLEAEICLKPAADDIVILRCNLDQKNFGDSKISVVKVSALLRSNTSAGEQPFYAWTYATIEGSQDGGASAQEADKRWCTEETVADAPLEPTPDLVQRLQQRFFDFGFVIPTNDGRLTPETVQAVIDFQKSSGLPATGQLTKLTVQKIDATEAPSPWVALAFDGAGNHTLVNGLTRRGAEADAISGFQRKSRGDYRVASVPSPNCLAFATTRYRGRRTRFTQAFSSAGRSAAEARDNALAYCDHEKGGGTCQVRDSLCAAGGDQPTPRYDPKNNPANTPAPRFDPKNLPVNATPPSLSSEPESDQAPESSESDTPPAKGSPPDDKPSDR